MDYKTFDRYLFEIFSQNNRLNEIPLESILDSIPLIDYTSGINDNPVVLVRADLDVPLKNGQVEDISRIESNLETIEFCLKNNWKTVLLGHIGREPDNTLEPVKNVLSDLLKKRAILIKNWIAESKNSISTKAINDVYSAPRETLLILENTRRYQIERALWDADSSSFPAISKKMFLLSEDIRNRLSSIEINEAIAASNIDFSSTSLPLLMKHTCFGFFIHNEMNHIKKVRGANLVVFTGLKLNKLDDLLGVIERGKLRLIIGGGSLAMALLKARAELQGQYFSIGIAETDSSKKIYIDSKRIEQAKKILKKCEEEKIEVLLPIDFILDNEQHSDTIPAGRSQMDIGPKSSALFREKLDEYVKKSKLDSQQYIMFYNGVFGKFEDAKFESGTKDFIKQLKGLTESGIETYVGGGEGRLALLKYGELSDVTHAFTCGGTVLKSLTNRHIPYLKALFIQNKYL